MINTGRLPNTLHRGVAYRDVSAQYIVANRFFLKRKTCIQRCRMYVPDLCQHVTWCRSTMASTMQTKTINMLLTKRNVCLTIYYRIDYCRVLNCNTCTSAKKGKNRINDYMEYWKVTNMTEWISRVGQSESVLTFIPRELEQLLLETWTLCVITFADSTSISRRKTKSI